MALVFTLVLVSPVPAGAEVSYTGSSTIGLHILPDATRAFTAKTGITVTTMGVEGSGKGLERLMRGECDLAGVSRSLTPAEKSARIGYAIIGYDPVTVFVHRDNPVRSLTQAQLKEIFTGRVTNWRQVGGRNAEIVVITQALSAKRGMAVEFQLLAMDGAPYRQDRREVDVQSAQAALLAGEPNGITSMSPAFAHPGVVAIALDGSTPDATHVRSGAYQLSRPLILVFAARPRSEVKRFIEFMLTPEAQAIVGRHFVSVR